MANSLPGSPIVGYYNESKEDFEEHNRVIDISNGKFEIKDTTRPYGFVSMDAKVWFQKFLDDGVYEHEYLMTEGYLWTGQYPECARIVEHGNNQSMELDDKNIDAYWSEDNNGNPQFFIINEAIISKLCILGEDCEPCFEGSTISNVQFSFDEGFKNQLFSMMNELKELLKEGGTQVFNTYSVKVGDTLWSALYSHIDETYPGVYSIDGIFEDEGQKYAILKNTNGEFSRLDFSVNGDAIEFAAELTAVEDYSVETPQFSAEDIEAFELEYKKSKDKKDEDESEKTEDKTEEDSNKEEKPSDDSKSNDKDEEEKPAEEDEEDDSKKKKKKYSCADTSTVDKYVEVENLNLNDIPDYTDLVNKYSELESKYNTLLAEKEELNNKLEPLIQFRNKVERDQKQEMINSFYMLSDEDKADVVNNIDNYSLEDIEAKLSIICVRNKVSFSQDEDSKSAAPTTYNLGNLAEDESTPAWVRAAMEVAKDLK